MEETDLGGMVSRYAYPYNIGGYEGRHGSRLHYALVTPCRRYRQGGKLRAGLPSRDPSLPLASEPLAVERIEEFSRNL